MNRDEQYAYDRLDDLVDHIAIDITDALQPYVTLDDVARMGHDDAVDMHEALEDLLALIKEVRDDLAS